MNENVSKEKVVAQTVMHLCISIAEDNNAEDNKFRIKMIKELCENYLSVAESDGNGNKNSPKKKLVE